MAFSPSSKNRLTRRDLARFPSSSLFDRVARVVCEARCLPRKELYEAWEMARRIRRITRGRRVVDVAGGHGLLAMMMLLLDDSSPSAIVVDPAIPPSAASLHEVVVAAWPRLTGRVEFRNADLATFTVEPDDLVVSCHACGPLTDRVIEAAIRAGAAVGVLPCCHDGKTCEAAPVSGWVDEALAIDLRRACRLEDASYRIWTQTIPAEITPRNRLLIGAPLASLPFGE